MKEHEQILGAAGRRQRPAEGVPDDRLDDGWKHLGDVRVLAIAGVIVLDDPVEISAAFAPLEDISIGRDVDFHRQPFFQLQLETIHR